jgi:hypothetical protein
MAKTRKFSPHQIEYRLLLAQVYDEKVKAVVTEALLRTTTEFTSFTYEIVVEPRLSAHELRLNIQGLRAPQLSMPEVGPALYKTSFPGLRGTYQLVVSKLGRDENVFTVTIVDVRAGEPRFWMSSPTLPTGSHVTNCRIGPFPFTASVS